MTENLTGVTSSWRTHLVESTPDIMRVLERVKRVAVIGIKPEAVGGPAFYVPERMQQVGYDIVPVPVYNQEIREILGEPVHRSLSTITPTVDMVQLFRRPNDVAWHIDEILAHRPHVVWMQLGIRNDAAAEQFARAGIEVIQDRCVKVELDRMRR